MHIALDFIRMNALCLSSLSPPRSPFRPREERPRAAELRPAADGWPGAGPVPCVPTPCHAAPACPALSPLSRLPFLGPRFRTADFLFFIASVCRCTPFRTFQLSLELMVGGASLSRGQPGSQPEGGARSSRGAALGGVHLSVAASYADPNRTRRASLQERTMES